jgi:hypothetical protein
MDEGVINILQFMTAHLLDIGQERITVAPAARPVG